MVDQAWARAGCRDDPAVPDYRGPEAQVPDWAAGQVLARAQDPAARADPDGSKNKLRNVRPSRWLMRHG